jgi:ribosomal protein S30
MLNNTVDTSRQNRIRDVDPGKALTLINKAKAKGSQIPSPNPKMKWSSPPLLKLRKNIGKRVLEASSDMTIPAGKQMTQTPTTPVDKKPQMHSDTSMVMVQGIDAMIEVNYLNTCTDDEPPECDTAQMGRKNMIWNMYGVARPKRCDILCEAASDSTQNVISMVKRKLNQEEQSEVYLTILETLAANYAEV